jgi:hypothetical protein
LAIERSAKKLGDRQREQPDRDERAPGDQAGAHQRVGFVMPPVFDDVGLAGAAAAQDPGDQEGDHQHVHDRADDEEDREQDQELAVLDAGVRRTRFGNAGSCRRRAAAGATTLPRRGHCSAVSALRAGSRGVSVCGVVAHLVGAARDASLLGWPDSERT